MKRRDFARISAGIAGTMAAGTFPLWSESGKPSVIFVKREEDTAAALKAALAATGELAFVKRGDSVLIKPCVNSDKPWPATSSPELLKLLIRSLKDRGAGEIIVGDRSGPHRDTEECMRKCGLLDAAKTAGAQVVFFENERYVELDLPQATNWRGRISEPQIVRDAHHVISLPTVRTHAIAGFTMTIKNWVGLVPMEKRHGMHVPFGFPQRVGELTLLRKPALTLLDGRQGFVEGGPDVGTLVKPGLFAAGTDPVALDVLGMAILAQNGAPPRISGQSPWRNPIINRAAEVAGGVRSGADIKVDAVNVKEIGDLLKFMETPH